MNNELQAFEPAAKALAATAVSQSLSFCMERKYLQNITDEENQLFDIKAIPLLKAVLRPSRKSFIHVSFPKKCSFYS